ncbi:DUF2785 domain-containing protein [Sporolactobacillus shoreae]|uniref:DUF2785 domain-containing protein n=1 Tax=Sporolactobacillus shoreae TaxID=1465501 RepID=A0A4Z0GLN6_9BACL|nr:DUF2785 domain-containing protein [Sporolactobacillus shoreae]TGA97681.1 DUF2785 domain-containing protein [Sporolactobacillus shoreae]
MELKNRLLEIQKNGYVLPKGLSEFEAVQLVMRSLSSPDGELRDALGYTILSKWLVEEHLLNGRQLKEILKQAVSEDMLYFKIGKSESDSVFLRSFSSLLIALILFRDNQEKFLNKNEFQENMNQLTHYCELEKDYRSFVVEKGWAHAPAHISDALDECVRSRFAGFNECQALWGSLQTMLRNAPNVFDAEEDERFAIPVLAMVELKKVTLADLFGWLEKVDIQDPEDIPVYSAVNRVNLTKRVNMKHFIRCLYMRMKEKSLLGKEQVEQLIQLEHKFNPYFYNI